MRRKKEARMAGTEHERMDIHIEGEFGSYAAITVDGVRITIARRAEDAEDRADEENREAFAGRTLAGKFHGRSDEAAKAGILAALRSAPSGLGRAELRAAARVKNSRLRQLQAELRADGFIEKRGRRWRLLSAGARSRSSPEARGVSVYFMQAVSGGLIKIGASARPEQRQAAAQALCPLELRLLAVLPGGFARERELHERFAAHRRHGEWFEPHPEILSWLAAQPLTT